MFTCQQFLQQPCLMPFCWHWWHTQPEEETIPRNTVNTWLLRPVQCWWYVYLQHEHSTYFERSSSVTQSLQTGQTFSHTVSSLRWRTPARATLKSSCSFDAPAEAGFVATSTTFTESCELIFFAFPLLLLVSFVACLRVGLLVAELPSLLFLLDLFDGHWYSSQASQGNKSAMVLCTVLSLQLSGHKPSSGRPWHFILCNVQEPNSNNQLESTKIIDLIQNYKMFLFTIE